MTDVNYKVIKWLDSLLNYGQPKRVLIRTISWIMPPSGVVKLNSDGGSCGNPGIGGGGGVIRDSHGHFIYGYSSSYGICSNTLVEVQALSQGVSWLISQGFRDSFLEMDSGFLFGCLAKGHSSP